MPRYVTNPPSAPTIEERIQIETLGHFTKLAEPPPWKVIGYADSSYNCVAWTLGVKETTLGENENPCPLTGVNEFYTAFGYRSTNGPEGITFQPYDVLAYGPNSTGVLHVAVYLNVAGVGLTWTSKMGRAQLITHTYQQLAAPEGSYGNCYPAYYTHGGTIPTFTGQTPEGETFEQTVQRLLRQHGLDRI